MTVSGGESGSNSLETLAAQWPIINNLSQHLPVGDLISLARANNILRTSLHGFEQSSLINPKARKDLHIGQHGTIYWQRLKATSPVECSSKTHTKGPKPKPCRYCSRPICEACIVRSSFARRNENTFKNRYRYLCKSCWESGNVSKSRRFPLQSQLVRDSCDDEDDHSNLYCICTLKNDGWLCIECKDRQNADATGDNIMQCHGEGCENPVGDDHANRRICLWCDRILPRQVGGTTRMAWNQKIIEARARNAASRQADLEEYNRKRLKQMRMSRREMRGDAAVKDDPEADAQILIRHFDVVNYRRYMPEHTAPDGNAVYDSKRGYWRYNRDFLLCLGKSCKNITPPTQTIKLVTNGDSSFVRTNAVWNEELRSLRYAIDEAFAIQNIPLRHRREHLKPAARLLYDMQKSRMAEWHHHKPTVLYLDKQKNLDIEKVKTIMREDYDFDARVEEYRLVLSGWNMAIDSFHSSKQQDELDAFLNNNIPSTNVLLKAALKQGPHSKAAYFLTTKCIFARYASIQEETLNRTLSRNSITSLSSLRMTSSHSSLSEAEDDLTMPNLQPVGSAPEAWDSAFTDSSTSPVSSDSVTPHEQVLAEDGELPLTGSILPVTSETHAATDTAPLDDPPPYAPGIWAWHEEDQQQNPSQNQSSGDLTLEIG